MTNSFKLRHSSESLVLSYLEIRRAIGYVGFSLPILLGPVGWAVFGIGIQENMSSYYHTPMRDVFVGVMCAIGIFLYCYRGTSRVEGWTRNLSCLSAIGIALCPLDAHSDPMYQRTIVGYLHTFAGGTFFLTLAIYSLVHFPQRAVSTSESDIESGTSNLDRIARNSVYIISGLTILGCMATIGICFFLVPTKVKVQLNALGFVFWMEWLAVWAFSAAWLTKGRAIFDDVMVPLKKLTHIVHGE
ncbi:MAG: hypothetical protein H7Z17_09005 [Fuerstia sp.]|nr:hypothetical protein [Fuerstiella sp.]